MRNPDFTNLEREIARSRIVLSGVAIVSVYLDPTTPILTRFPLTGGAFVIDPYALAIMISHLVYAIAMFAVVARRETASVRLATIATWADVAYGAAIALVTEGATSPAYAFFAFAVVAAGCRSGFRATLAMTAVSVTVYLVLILASPHSTASLYVMRPAYLAITGYLIGYLGQQRLSFEARVRELEAAAERQSIARSLHDGYVQALAGVNLRLESCRELLRRRRGDDALAQLTELQTGVKREYDDLRAYIRSLVDLERSEAMLPTGAGPRFAIEASFRGDGTMVEHVLQIMLEGARNVRRHARARTAAISALGAEERVRIMIDDDGLGFPHSVSAPWSIASRVGEIGGEVRIARQAAGAHLVIDIPLSAPLS